MIPFPRISPLRRPLALPATALLLFVGCQRTAANGGDADANRNSFVLGVGALPSSPGYASVLRGIELAVERLNEQSQITFRLQTPAAGALSAVQVAQQLRDTPAVIGVVGHPESGNSLEAIPVYADAEGAGARAVVAVSPTASSPRLSGVSPWFFRVAPSDDDAARVTARWARDSLGARRAAIIYRNDSYGRDWSATFAETFADTTAVLAGAARAVVVARDPYLHGITEWDAYAQMLAALRPDVLLFPGDAEDALAMRRALKERNVSIPFIGGDGTEQMNESADGIGAYFVAFFRSDRASSVEATHFLTQYRDKYRQEPDMFAALSYDAAIVMGRTIIGGARTRRALRLALERIGNGAPSVDGVAGRIAFEKNHDIKGRSVVIARIDRIAGEGAP